MKQSPELMTRALNLHNAAIRKARWTNFGYTIEQEGDSYSLCFYEPLDAVMFCLMVSSHAMPCMGMENWEKAHHTRGCLGGWGLGKSAPDQTRGCLGGWVGVP